MGSSIVHQAHYIDWIGYIHPGCKQTMPEKQPFDHRLHLLEKEKVTASLEAVEATKDDEAFARILQQEILEEERRDRSSGAVGGMNGYNLADASLYSRSNLPPPDTTGDMQLLMALQREEMEALRDNRHDDDLELARRIQHEEALGQIHSEYQDQLISAQRIRERAYGGSAANDFPGISGDVYPASYNAQRDISSSATRGQSSHQADHDADLDLARRMQELEQMGMGRLNSERSIPTDRTSPVQTRSSRSRQEEEDARLARMIAESGQSLREIQPEPSAKPPPPVPAPSPPEPSRKSVSEPRRPLSSDTPPPFREIVIPTQQFPILDQAAISRPSRSPKVSGSGRESMSPNRSVRPSNPPGVAMLRDHMDDQFTVNGATVSDNGVGKDRKKNFGSLFGRSSKDKVAKSDRQSSQKAPPSVIPSPIPPRPQQGNNPILPYSSIGSQLVNVPIADAATQKKKVLTLPKKNASICSSCQKPAVNFLIALDKKYHHECFRCAGCYNTLDANGPFAYMTDESGNKHPLHRSCYVELYGVKCAVCRKSIPAGPDGKVSFVKHPFFDQEQMCPEHAKNPGRRCTGCHRFEPETEPFAELNDAGRCVCYSCCRSVVVDSEDAQPLWDGVVNFFEHVLNLPIWKEMRKVPILVVGYEALNEQMMSTGAVHGGSSQITTRGLCLTEHQSGRKLKLAKLKYNKNNSSFVSVDVEARGYTYFQVPDANKVNPDASVTAILCLSGLPRDLTASVLAHEATHAWIKLHPRFDVGNPIPIQVEEGCAQLIAMLYLTEGMLPASTNTYGDSGPSDEKLRQYFKFSIETDDHEIYGEGYRKAAAAYANIGIEALLSHVVLYKTFPKT